MWTLQRIASAILFAFFLARRGYKKKSLNFSGAIMGGVVAAIHILACNNAVFLMAIFYFTSSYLTKYKAEIKKKIEEDFQEGGQRNWIQVLANAGIGVVLCAVWIYMGNAGQDLAFDLQNNFWSSMVLLAWIGQYACANGDTWSSELGILSKGEPRLVTTLKKVPKGTNGGVSLLGLGASFGGGLLIGITAFLCNFFFSSGTAASQAPLILMGIIGGLGGSLVDSFLGATVQYSGWDPKQQKVVKAAGPNVKHITGLNILDNHQVNFVANLLSTVLLPVLGVIMYS